MDTFAGNKGVQDATTWLFELSKANNYIRMPDIRKNIKWSHEGSIGNIDITINLSKPEKDPKAIAAAKLLPKTGYPACMLCPENVGFAGNLNHPARQTLRTIPIELDGEPWELQYSPYQYYTEHVIAFSSEHRPMAVYRFKRGSSHRRRLHTYARPLSGRRESSAHDDERLPQDV